MTETRIIIGVNSEGRYIALSRSAPYFCFDGASEAAVIEAVKGALAFYARYQEKRRAVKVVSRTVTHTITKLAPRRFVGFIAHALIISCYVAGVNLSHRHKIAMASIQSPNETPRQELT